MYILLYNLNEWPFRITYFVLSTFLWYCPHSPFIQMSALCILPYYAFHLNFLFITSYSSFTDVYLCMLWWKLIFYPLAVALCFCSLQLLTSIGISSPTITGVGWRTMFIRRRRIPASSGSYNRLQMRAVWERRKNKDWYIRCSWDSSSVIGSLAFMPN